MQHIFLLGINGSKYVAALFSVASVTMSIDKVIYCLLNGRYGSHIGVILE